MWVLDGKPLNSLVLVLEWDKRILVLLTEYSGGVSKIVINQDKLHFNVMQEIKKSFLDNFMPANNEL